MISLRLNLPLRLQNAFRWRFFAWLPLVSQFVFDFTTMHTAEITKCHHAQNQHFVTSSPAVTTMAQAPDAIYACLPHRVRGMLTKQMGPIDGPHDSYLSPYRSPFLLSMNEQHGLDECAGHHRCRIQTTRTAQLRLNPLSLPQQGLEVKNQMPTSQVNKQLHHQCPYPAVHPQ